MNIGIPEKQIMQFELFLLQSDKQMQKKNSSREQPSQRLFEVFKPSEKECTNHHLLNTVRQINGDMAFKQVCQKCLVMKFTSRTQVPDQYTNDFFCYIVQGEVYVYKVNRHKKENSDDSSSRHQVITSKGVFITCHKSHQIFGLQQYPLNVAQFLIFQASQGCKILVFPLELSLSSFKKIFNMNLVQTRAEILKRFDFFKEFEIQKLKKIALYSKRYQLERGQILQKEQVTRHFLLLIISGQIISVENKMKKDIYSKDMAIGLKQILDEKHESQIELICFSNCELLLIPKIHIIKAYKIKYRLEEKQSVPIAKSRRVTQYEEDKEEKKIQKRESSYKNRSVIYSMTEQNYSSKGMRPQTSVLRRDTSNSKERKYMTFYNPKKGQSSSIRHAKTEGSDLSSSKVLKKDREQKDLFIGVEQHRSLGEMCLRKFLNRKERRQNCEIMKYLKSNAPELKLNPSKQYAVMKPLHVSGSSYVKTFKRKLRKTYLKHGQNPHKQEKQKDARFSLFFKDEDG